MRIIIIALFSILLFMPNVKAQENISMNIQKKECILGEALSFTITVESEKPITEDFSAVKINDKLIEFKKSPSTSSYKSIINGKVYAKESFKNEYQFSFTPLQEGLVELPAFTFKINDKTSQTTPITFTVKPMPFTDNFNAFIIINGKRDFYYPSEIVDVEVIFALKNNKFAVHYPVMGGFNWLENQGLHNLQANERNTNLLINNKEYPVFFVNTSNNLPPNNYKDVLSFKLKFRAINPGVYGIDNCLVKAEATTGRTTMQRNFMGFSQAVEETVSVYSKIKPIQFEVKALPEKNKPLDFSGAIGSYSIEVVSSSDTDLKVGDPITLHIKIKGDGAWELVNCPALQKSAAITDFFRLGAEMPSGVVNEDLHEKEFVVKLRVKSTAVKEIPAIAFSYFDISKNQYITKYSKPIPIKVFENTNKIEVVTFEESEKNITKTPVAENKGEPKDIKDIPLNPIEIMSVFKNEGLSENHQTDYSFLYLSFLAFIIIAAVFLITRIAGSGAVEKAQVVVSIKKANSKCIEKLSALEKHIDEGEVIYKRIGDCLDEFFKIKFIEKKVYSNLSAESLQKLITEGLISPVVGVKLMEAFEKWENQKFSKTSFNPTDVKSLIIEFKKVVGEC